MRRFLWATVVTGLCLLLVSGVAFGQSSGNFTYGTNAATERCVLNNNNTGTISGGLPCSLPSGPSCTTTADCAAVTGQTVTCFNPSGGTLTGLCVTGASGSCTSSSQCQPGATCVIPSGATTGVCGATENGACIGDLKAGIKTSSGSGNVFVIRPSAVIGLLTDVTVAKNSTIDIGTSSALAGVDFSVTVTAESGQGTPTVIPSYPITYDARFIQISTNLFDALGTTCTTTTGCFISFNESTVSAHSFDWIVTGLSSGNYGVEVDWTSSLGDFGLARSMTCVGPVNLTVQQNKIFSFNTVNSL